MEAMNGKTPQVWKMKTIIIIAKTLILDWKACPQLICTQTLHISAIWDIIIHNQAETRAVAVHRSKTNRKD
jgi:hypothetical protein